jgi:glycosyl transferase family 87
MNDRNAVASRPPLGILDFVASLDRRVVVAFGAVVCLFMADVLLPEFLAGGKTKDYELWYQTGRAMLDGRDIYAGRDDGLLSFLYPPVAAVLLAPLALLGKPLMYAALVILNAAAWVVVVAKTRALCAFAPRSTASDVLPSVIALPLIFLTFDLGQPNLLLLAFILSGFAAIERERSGLGGALMGFAAAIKVFPAALVLYLLARRRWRAAASMTLTVVVLSLAVPALVWGPQKAASDLARWGTAMTSVDEKVFGQRPNHNWSYRNQSLFALTHRLFRPVDAAERQAPQQAVHVDIVDLGFAGANRAYLVLSSLVGAAFLALLAKADSTRREVRVCEVGILLCLDVLASPEAHDYYFVWLMFPIAALIDLYRTRQSVAERRTIALCLFAAVLSMASAINGLPIVFQAYGCMVWATGFVIVGLAFAISTCKASDRSRDAQPVETKTIGAANASAME